MSSLFLPKSNLNVALLARPPELGSVAHASLQSHFSTFDLLSFPDKPSLEAGIIHALRTHGCATGVLPRPIQLTTSVSVLAHLLSPSTTPRLSPHRHLLPALRPRISSRISSRTPPFPPPHPPLFPTNMTKMVSRLSQHAPTPPATPPPPTNSVYPSRRPSATTSKPICQPSVPHFHYRSTRPPSASMLAALPLRLMSPSPSRIPTRCSFTPT